MLYGKILQVLVLAITRESSGAFSKGRGGLTSSEDTVLGPAIDDYDVPGGQVARLYAVWHAEQREPSLVLRSPGPRLMRSIVAPVTSSSV
jgi:hypothetical protein